MAWAHYQFETLHPFLDGNGRVGRLLMPLQLATRRRLSHPLLYLSPYFETRRSEYYGRLFAVSAESHWDGWLQFFLEAVLHQAHEGVQLARRILDLFTDWERRLLEANAPANAFRAMRLAQYHIAVDAKTVERGLGVAPQTAYNQLKTLTQVGVLREAAIPAVGRKLYFADELVGLLSSGA